MKTIEVLGTPLTATSYEEFTDYCHELSREPRARAVDLSNTQVVTMRRHEPEFREITSCFDFFLPDGMPLVWCLNRRGARLRDRVYGPTFMRIFLERSPAPFTHYLLGGSADCLARLQGRLLAMQPALRIVGARDGYFGADEEEQIVAEINRISPDFIWVGLGTPKQQDWIYRHQKNISRGLLLAVGFAFDVNAGSKKDAPKWMQRRGLTWLFRLLSEPRRLALRYLRYNTLFLFYLCKDALLARGRVSKPSAV
jgi:N-acetylglucosaminyldiphosphoundecaprenol N-acetyl-beta-D-mannosaminyltransferase